MNYYKLSEQDLWLTNDLHRHMDIVAKRKCFSEEDEKAKNERLDGLNDELKEILDEALMKIPDVEIETTIRNEPMISNHKGFEGITFFNITDEEKCGHLIRVTKETKTCPLTKGLKVKIVGKMINNFGTIEAYEITEAEKGVE